MLESSEAICKAIASLESSSIRFEFPLVGFEFPSGGNVPIPTSSEEKLLAIIRNEMPLTNDTVVGVRSRLNFDQNTGVAIFAVRIAILAVQRHDTQLFRLGMSGLLFTGSDIDYRDFLGVLSITQYCAQRLQINFQSEVESLSEIADKSIRELMLGYLKRPSELRNVEAFGFMIENTGDVISIRWRY